MYTRDRIFEVYGAQLGELTWHSLNVDPQLSVVSEQHGKSILDMAKRFRIQAKGRPIRILEVGAYAHYGAHRAAAALGGLSVAHDVSPTSLRLGMEAAQAVGLKGQPTLVAGDFHDLPFSTGYFDIVFCASSIHHTYRPWLVLREIMRVLRPGGLLQLENEPVGRALCFYGFRSNRTNELSGFESQLEKNSTLFTFSSPFLGSRPEMLFGMIENDRIPLDMIMGALTAEGDISLLQLAPIIAEFEKRILALPRDQNLEARIADLLMAEVTSARPALTERDRLLGISLPGPDAIWRVCYDVAPGLRRLTGLTGQEADREMARLFGAALKATVIKRGSDGPDVPLFRRLLPKTNEVFNDAPHLPGLTIDFHALPIPSIEAGDAASLAAAYPAEEWELFREHNGINSMMNLGSRCRINLPGLPTAAILMLRFFAVAADQPYTIRLRLQDSAEISSITAVYSETLLIRELVPASSTLLFMELRGLDGNLVSLPRHIRLVVGRLIPINM